jgi:hypothetical protein
MHTIDLERNRKRLVAAAQRYLGALHHKRNYPNCPFCELNDDRDFRDVIDRYREAVADYPSDELAKLIVAGAKNG